MSRSTFNWGFSRGSRCSTPHSSVVNDQIARHGRRSSEIASRESFGPRARTLSPPLSDSGRHEPKQWSYHDRSPDSQRTTWQHGFLHSHRDRDSTETGRVHCRSDLVKRCFPARVAGMFSTTLTFTVMGLELRDCNLSTARVIAACRDETDPGPGTT